MYVNNNPLTLNPNPNQGAEGREGDFGGGGRMSSGKFQGGGQMMGHGRIRPPSAPASRRRTPLNLGKRFGVSRAVPWSSADRRLHIDVRCVVAVCRLVVDFTQNCGEMNGK